MWSTNKVVAVVVTPVGESCAWALSTALKLTFKKLTKKKLSKAKLRKESKLKNTTGKLEIR